MDIINHVNKPEPVFVKSTAVLILIGVSAAVQARKIFYIIFSVTVELRSKVKQFD